MLALLQAPPEETIEGAQQVNIGLVMIQSKLYDLQAAGSDQAKAKAAAKAIRIELDSVLDLIETIRENTETISNDMEIIEKDLGLEVL